MLVALILMAQAALLSYEAVVHSPTLNEPGHLVAGVSYWHFGSFDVYHVNPPLIKLVAAAPVMALRPEMDWRRMYKGPGSRDEFHLGEDFVAANGERAFWYITVGRWACIPFVLLGGYTCRLWARELYGPCAGLLALALWAFCPNVLAHGSLITPDVAAAALGITACYAFWRWLKRPRWGGAIVAGVLLGIAELSKTTLLVFYVVWPTLWLFDRWPPSQPRPPNDWLRQLGQLTALLVISLYVINAGYGFEGSGTPLGQFRFVSRALSGRSEHEGPAIPGGNRFADCWLGKLSVPLPRNFVLGLDAQKRDFETYPQPSYLGGKFAAHGWWYYYLYALAIKVPLGTWLLVVLAAIAPKGVTDRVRWRDEVVLLCPVLLIVAFVSGHTAFNQHMRYVLPAFPFVLVWIARVARSFNRMHGRFAAAVGAALAWSFVSSLWFFPHNLSYFNELAGGPTKGPEHLIHSNVDWGQDLFYLKHWLSEHPDARPMNLAYFGYFDPHYAGLEYTTENLTSSTLGPDTEPKIPAGWYAISVNLVRGFPCFIYDENGAKLSLSQNAVAAFQRLEPVARAGYSISIYHVER